MDNENENKIMKIVDNIYWKYKFQSGEQLQQYKDEFIAEIKSQNIIYDRATDYILTENNYHTANKILQEWSEVYAKSDNILQGK